MRFLDKKSAFPKLFRRYARVMLKKPAEIAVILFANLVRDFADAQGRLFEQGFGFEQEHLVQNIVGGFAGCGMQAAVQVGL